MPIYEFVCEQCDEAFETAQPMARASGRGVACPRCGSDRLERRYGQVYAVTSKKS